MMAGDWAKVLRSASKVRAVIFGGVVVVAMCSLLAAAWDAVAAFGQPWAKLLYVHSGNRAWAISSGRGNICLIFYHVKSEGVTLNLVATGLSYVDTSEQAPGRPRFGAVLAQFPPYPYSGKTAFRFTNTKHPDFVNPRHLVDIAFPPGIALRFEDRVESEIQLRAGGHLYYYPARRLASFMAPDWFLAIVFGLIAWPLGRPYWRAFARLRRAARGLCACGYDLRGHHAGDRCPECGVGVAAKMDPESPVAS